MKFIEFLTKYWEAIVALCALVVSVFATVISWRGLRIQQAHNETSLRPIIFIEPYDYEDCILVKIKNEGLAPAIVKNLYVQDSLNMSKASIFNWLPKVLPGDMDYREYWTRNKDFVLRSGSIDHMLEIRVDTNQPEQVGARENIRAILSDLIVYIEYEDVYKKAMPTYSRELRLFGRSDHINSENASNNALKSQAAPAGTPQSGAP